MFFSEAGRAGGLPFRSGGFVPHHDSCGLSFLPLNILLPYRSFIPFVYFLFPYWHSRLQFIDQVFDGMHGLCSMRTRDCQNNAGTLDGTFAQHMHRCNLADTVILVDRLDAQLLQFLDCHGDVAFVAKLSHDLAIEIVASCADKGGDCSTGFVTDKVVALFERW